MTEERPRTRPSIRVGVSNWRRSDLPFFRRLGVALRNLSRRVALPPRDCCGNAGAPGC